jgi:hypothetical protein
VSANHEPGTFGPDPARIGGPGALILIDDEPERPHTTAESLIQLPLILGWDIVEKSPKDAVGHHTQLVVFETAKRGTGFRNRTGGAGKEPAGSNDRTGRNQVSAEIFGLAADCR